MTPSGKVAERTHHNPGIPLMSEVKIEAICRNNLLLKEVRNVMGVA